MNYIATRPFSVTSAGKRVAYGVGDKLTSARYAKLSKRLQSLCVTSRRWATLNRETYSPAELFFIAEEYLKTAAAELNQSSENAIAEEFVSIFDTHSLNSVTMVVRQIVKADCQYDAEGLDGMSESLHTILESMAPGRFVR